MWFAPPASASRDANRASGVSRVASSIARRLPGGGAMNANGSSEGGSCGGVPQLRRVIQAATNKSELFNRYAQWVSFGSSGLATAAERDEQRRMIKYNHLVANLLIFHTAVGMTRALDEIAADGHGNAITPEALAGTSPYLTEHLNRFGSYE